MTIVALSPDTAVDQNELLASICQDSFYDFLQEFWEELIPDKPIWNWHVRFLCEELQVVAERVMTGKSREYDLVINIPPGSTKSTICSIAFPAWVWTRWPHARFICGSYEHSLALELSRKCRDLLRSEKYRACFPRVQLRDDQDTKGYFVTTLNGSRFAVGSGGSAIGRHAHFLIVDDPIDPNAALSDAELRSTNTWMDEHLSQRVVNKDVSTTILVMQRLHQNDPTGNMLGKKTPVRHICLPAELDDNVSPSECVKWYKEDLLDPVRLSAKALARALKTLGEYGYAAQFRQSPVPRGGGMFKVDRIVVDTPPAQFRRVVRYWDKAGTQRGGAFTVGVKMGLDRNDLIWILHVVRGQWSSDDRENIILQTAKLDGRSVSIGMEQEPGSSGKESYERSAKRLMGFHVRADRVTGDKELRADAFSTSVNSGLVRVPVDAPWLPDYLDELRYFPFSKYKDQVDSSSGAFNLLVALRRTIGALR